MANFPGGVNTLPGVYSISDYFSIERIDNGYHIRKFLGPDSNVIEWKGSSKYIAKQLIVIVKDSHSEKTKGDSSLHTFHNKPFTIYLPELECAIDDDIKNIGNVDIDEVEVEISNEMKKLKHLLIFL